MVGKWSARIAGNAWHVTVLLVEHLEVGIEGILTQLLDIVWTKCVRAQKFALAPTPIPGRGFVGLICGWRPAAIPRVSIFSSAEGDADRSCSCTRCADHQHAAILAVVEPRQQHRVEGFDGASISSGSSPMSCGSSTMMTSARRPVKRPRNEVTKTPPPEVVPKSVTSAWPFLIRVAKASLNQADLQNRADVASNRFRQVLGVGDDNDFERRIVGQHPR